jgi:hypothetical protein
MALRAKSHTLPQRGEKPFVFLRICGEKIKMTGLK